MSEVQPATVRVVNLRLPPDLLVQIDAFARSTTPEDRPTSRHAALLALLRRGLNDIERVKRDKKRPR